MDRVFAFAEHSVGDDYWVAIAIGEPQEGQRHIGILHRIKDADPEVLHLAWHCNLKNDASVPKYLVAWVAPTIPLSRQRSVAAFCRRVWRKNGQGNIPYAFSNPSQSLNPQTGEFLLGPTNLGLTCGSFVLAVFAASGVAIADLKTWPCGREGDDQWQQDIVDVLEHYGATPEHIHHLRHEIGAVRYRPEEVAACLAITPYPAAFRNAEALGSQILSRIRQLSTSADESE